MRCFYCLGFRRSCLGGIFGRFAYDPFVFLVSKLEFLSTLALSLEEKAKESRFFAKVILSLLLPFLSQSFINEDF